MAKKRLQIKVASAMFPGVGEYLSSVKSERDTAQELYIGKLRACAALQCPIRELHMTDEFLEKRLACVYDAMSDQEIGEQFRYTDWPFADICKP